MEPDGTLFEKESSFITNALDTRPAAVEEKVMK